MIRLYSFDQLGHADHGWLDTHHHFSFAAYWNPNRVQFGALRVVNDDKVAPGTGFGTHPHDNMEIITYVRQGAITHKDSMGNVGRTEAGDVQVMSAGSGILHSEHNLESEDTLFYQIWIIPNRNNVKPRWEAREFPKAVVRSGPLPVLVSGREDDVAKGALFIFQDAAVYGGRLAAASEIRQPIRGQAYVLASVGTFTANDAVLKPGDGAEVTGEKILTLKAGADAEVLVIDIPASV